MNYDMVLHHAHSLQRKLNIDNDENCCLCGRPKTEDHHIFPTHLGGPENGPTVPLCSNHHRDLHYAHSKIKSGVYPDIAFNSKAVQEKALDLVQMLIFASSVEVPKDHPRKLMFKIPDDLLKKAHLRKIDAGFSNLQDYILNLIVKDTNIL